MRSPATGVGSDSSWFRFPLLIWGTCLRTVDSAYAHDGVRIFTYQCAEVHQFVALCLAFGQVARHAEQFISQISCLLLAKATFEAGLRSCPVRRRFLMLRRPFPGEYDAQSPVALPFSRCGHQGTPEQGLKRPDESRSVHHHRLGQFGHGQIRTTAQCPENAELRGRDAGLGQVVLVKLRNVSRGLPKGETVVVGKIV